MLFRSKLEQAYKEVSTVNEELQSVNANLENVVEKRTEELRFTIKKLVETDEGLNTFLYRSSHDLRGPITSLLGLAHLAKVQNQQDILVPYFFNMEHTALSMMRLLNRLGETAALFRATRHVTVVLVDEFLQSVRDQLNTINGHDDIRIEMENKIGKSILSDPTMLNHIVFHLMENSIVFRNGKDPFVGCKVYLKNHYFMIEVVDNGVGISPEVKDKIFEMFYRGSERSIGNGLGLFIVKKALEILEGTIEIESDPNKLTKFTVLIPYVT